MKRKTPLKRGSSPLKASVKRLKGKSAKYGPIDKTPRKAIKRKPRTVSEYRRIYGSPARVKWVKKLPCLVCSRGPCQNAHVTTGGTGRKADARFIVPLCFDHHNEHHGGAQTFEAKYGLDLLAAAATTASLWNRLHPEES